MRTETVRLNNEWTAQHGIVEATTAALEERARMTEAKRDNVKAKNASDQADIHGVEAKNQAVDDSIREADSRLKQLRERLVQIRPSLPPRLSEALELPYRSLANPDLAPVDRMQLTMTILNRCVQFNRTISYDQEPVSLDGGANRKLLEVIYWGLNRGYALDRPAGQAWFGSPGPNGWHWEAHPEAVAQVANLIAVANDKAEPNFVAAPAALLHVAPEASK
jgi:hypothetical protein